MNTKTILILGGTAAVIAALAYYGKKNQPVTAVINPPNQDPDPNGAIKPPKFAYDPVPDSPVDYAAPIDTGATNPVLYAGVGVSQNLPVYLQNPETKYTTPATPPVVPAPKTDYVADKPIYIPPSEAPIVKPLVAPDRSLPPKLRMQQLKTLLGPYSFQ